MGLNLDRRDTNRMCGPWLDSDLKERLSKCVDNWEHLNMCSVLAITKVIAFLESDSGWGQMGQCPYFQEMHTEALQGRGIMVSATYF